MIFLYSAFLFLFQSLAKLCVFGKTVHFICFPRIGIVLWTALPLGFQKSQLHLWQRVSVLVHFCMCFISLFLLHLAFRSYHFISLCSESALGFIISSIVSLFSILPNLCFLLISSHLLLSGSFSWVYNSATAFKMIKHPSHYHFWCTLPVSVYFIFMIIQLQPYFLSGEAVWGCDKKDGSASWTSYCITLCLNFINCKLIEYL